MNSIIYFLIFLFPNLVYGYTTLYSKENIEERRTKFMVNLITSNLSPNGWSNILCVGTLPDSFHVSMKELIGPKFSFSNIVPGQIDHDLGEVSQHYSNVIIIHCTDFNEFEAALKKAMNSPYWHPQSHLILYYHEREQDDIPKIFMIFWFYKVCNAIIAQYHDDEETMMLSYYNPYISSNYHLPYEFGCWKVTTLDRAVRKLRDSFVCVEGCHNITVNSKLRSKHLGTCIGIQKHKALYGDIEGIKKLNLFEDKSNNLHGFTLRGFAGEVLPFLAIEEKNDGSFSLGSRDGMMWNTAAELMNFRIDLNASKATLKTPFNFEVNIQQIYTFARREADLVIYPVYQFDLVFVEIDFSIAYKDSGVCILSHRAGFQTVLFDAKLLQENTDLTVKFILCFNLIWLVFFVFSVVEKGTFSFDQVGKDLVNTIRNVLSITLYKPPKSFESFRIYLAVSIWSFFVLNFIAQAAIISFFSAYKRGKEVNMFEDVIEKGYIVEAMASPDMMLPDNEERFQKFNSMLVPIKNLFECVDRISNDSRRFCLIDCSVGHYLVRNRLDKKGEQFLHIAMDRIHAHYLVMIFHKHCPLTKTFNKYFRMFFEAGLIMKWEQYRFSNLKPDVPVKALSLEDLIGIFKCYCLLLILSSAIFIIEIVIHLVKFFKIYSFIKISKWKRTRAAKKKLLLEKRLGKIKLIDSFSQTI